MNAKTILSLAAAIMWALNAAFITEPSRAWGLKHSESEGASLFMSAGFAFFVVDTFRVLVDWRRRA